MRRAHQYIEHAAKHTDEHHCRAFTRQQDVKGFLQGGDLNSKRENLKETGIEEGEGGN